MAEPDRKDEEKRQRLAEALRANLRRRKDQARGRRDDSASATETGQGGNGET